MQKEAIVINIVPCSLTIVPVQLRPFSMYNNEEGIKEIHYHNLSKRQQIAKGKTQGNNGITLVSMKNSGLRITQLLTFTWW